MLFNSLPFFVFLALVLPSYYALGLRNQNRLLLVVSYFFYGWWDWRFCGLLLLSTVVDYHVAQGIGRTSDTARRRMLLGISLFVNLGILGFFKYFNFFAGSLLSLAAMFGFRVDWVSLNIILPMGISFYTFQTLAYTIDVYRGRQPTDDPVLFALYVCYFPQLVAGPIERAETLLPQLDNPRLVGRKQISEGLLLITIGMFRKVAVADSVGQWADRCFADPKIYSSTGLIVGLTLFAVQIYCDFAGYSEIARGTSKLLGIELMENFRQPYFSTSITEFWRRWHISLSTWLRDYLYIPLGGNRRGRARTYLNLLATMLIGGLWHGASWNFVIWGGLHGLYLGVHKFVLELRSNTDTGSPPSRFVGAIATFGLVATAWIFFRARDFSSAIDFLIGILSFQGPIIGPHSALVLEPALALFTSTLSILIIDVPQYRSRNHTVALNWSAFRLALFLTFLTTGICLFAGGDDVQFIYFQF